MVNMDEERMSKPATRRSKRLIEFIVRMNPVRLPKTTVFIGAAESWVAFQPSSYTRNIKWSLTG